MNTGTPNFKRETTMNESMMTKKDVARWINRSTRTADRWVEKGSLPPLQAQLQKGGGMIRVVITFVLLLLAGGVLIVEFGLGRM